MPISIDSVMQISDPHDVVPTCVAYSSKAKVTAANTQYVDVGVMKLISISLLQQSLCLKIRYFLGHPERAVGKMRFNIVITLR